MKEYTAKIEVRVTPAMREMIDRICAKLKRRPSSWIRGVIEDELSLYGYNEIAAFLTPENAPAPESSPGEPAASKTESTAGKSGGDA